MTNIRFSLALATLFAITLSPMPNSSAFAAGEEEPSGDLASNKTLDLSGLILPIERDGELINYLFVSMMVTLSDELDQWEIRENAHVYRDLILKEAHKTPVGKAGHPMALDEKRLRQIVDGVFEERHGDGAVVGMDISSIDSLKVFLEEF